MDSRPYTVHIYESEAKLISQWTLQYSNKETGGDLFGLWINENEIVIQAVLGPGQNCRRTATSFFQDEQYLSKVGESLTQDQGLCNVGSWHSHHTMNLPDPSRGDKDTVWKHLPTPGRFVLLIAAIKTETGAPKVEMGFNLFESTIKGNKLTSLKLDILQGKSPIRANNAISSKVLEGAESDSEKQPYPEPTVESSLVRPEVNKRLRAKKPEVSRPDMKSNRKYDDGSGVFGDKCQRPGRQEHRRPPNRDATCDGVPSTSRYYNTDRSRYSEFRPSRNQFDRPYKLRSWYRRDGTEMLVLYHFNHIAGKCDVCFNARLERSTNGDFHAVIRQHEPECCIIF